VVEERYDHRVIRHQRFLPRRAERETAPDVKPRS
jgi:hypothetical protein